MSGPVPNPARSPNEGTIVCSREFPSSPDAVFQAFSDPVRLARWWGPKGFTNTFHQFDFRVGGVWRFTMHGPDGTAHAMEHRFDEIVRPERIVVRHIQPGHDFLLTVTLAIRDTGTRLTWAMQFADPAEGERVRAFVAAANEENFDKLTIHLAQTAVTA